MKLSEIIEQAYHGELSSVSKKDKTDDVIISYINLGLQALYNIFILDTGEAIIKLRHDIMKTIYTMNSSDPDVSVNGVPMEDDEFMVVYKAFDEDGSEIPVNVHVEAELGDEALYDKYRNAIATVSYNQIQVPLLADNAYISIIYRKNPKFIRFIDDGNGRATDCDVRLPRQLLEPLLHYVGYRAHGAINGNIQAENNTHYTRFLRSINSIKQAGILPYDSVVVNNIRNKGFV